MHHGQGGRKDERPIDRERFFRVIDREIMERASKVSRLPLVLAALPEHQTHFRTLSHNPFLTATGIAVNPASLTPGELRDAAWKAIEPHFEDRLSALLDAYGEARGHGRASDRLDEIAAALTQGRVGTLLLEADRRIPGSAADCDVLDDLAEAALGTSAEVIVLPPDRMPTNTGAAAVFRYQLE